MNQFSTLQTVNVNGSAVVTSYAEVTRFAWDRMRSAWKHAQIIASRHGEDHPQALELTALASRLEEVVEGSASMTLPLQEAADLAWNLRA